MVFMLIADGHAVIAAGHSHAGHTDIVNLLACAAIIHIDERAGGIKDIVDDVCICGATAAACGGVRAAKHDIPFFQILTKTIQMCSDMLHDFRKSFRFNFEIIENLLIACNSDVKW